MAILQDMQGSFAGGELSPALYGRTDLAKFNNGLKRASNCFIHAHGGVSNRTGFQFIGRAKVSGSAVRLIPFEFNTTQTYILEFGELYMRVIKDGGYVLETAKNITGATQANPCVITSNAHGFSNGDEVYITGAGGMTQINGRNFKVANVAANTFELQDLYGNNVNSSAYTAYTSGGTVARVYTVTSPYSASDLALLKYAQSADVLYMTHPSYAVRKLSRTGHAAWTFTTVTFTASISAPTSVSATPSTGGGTAYVYVVTAVKDETLEESVASSSATANSATLSSTNTVTVSWSAVTGATKYNIYKDDNGLYGFIGSTESTSFIDKNIAADTTDTPPKARNPFSSADNYPGTVTFHEQRLTFAGTNNKPQTFYMSQTSAFENMNVSSPTKDNDAVTFGIAARQVHQIRHMVPLGDLLVLTSGGEWKISPGSNGDVITPASISVKPQGYRGSSHVPPIVIGNIVLYIQAIGCAIRDLGYKLDADGYVGDDLTVLATHLFEGYTIVDWAYCQYPYSIVWVVRSDGALLSLTYLREHQVWAWARHSTDGSFKSVASVAEGNENALYAVVERTINSQTVKYVERLHSRLFTAVEDCFFVDSGLTYDGSAATTISGLDHLEGEAVVALADGNVIKDLTVSAGRITLPTSASVVHVGLAYQSDVQTLPIEYPSQTGAVHAKKKAIGEIALRVVNTRGMWFGPDEDNLTEYKQRSSEVWGDPIALKSGIIDDIVITPDWTNDASIWVQQTDPLPMTIQAIVEGVRNG